MNRALLFIAGGIAIGLIGAGSYLVLSKRQERIVSPNGAATLTPTPAPQLTTWNDPAGFTLQYQQGLMVNKHDEDSINYAHVEFTMPGKPGNLIVWVKDIPSGVSDTKSWVKNDASLSAGMTFDTLLGGRPAQKILLSGVPKKEIIGSVYDDALFYVETTLDDAGYWSKMTDSITSSFVFKPINVTPTGTAAAGGSDASTSVDEEEVLQ